MKTLQPWPRDAVIIVCPFPASANRSQMELPIPAICQDCGRNVVVDVRSLRTAQALPERRGRPVRCLCLRCYDGYRPEFDVLVDHRRPHD